MASAWVVSLIPSSAPHLRYLVNRKFTPGARLTIKGLVPVLSLPTADFKPLGQGLVLEEKPIFRASGAGNYTLVFTYRNQNSAPLPLENSFDVIALSENVKSKTATTLVMPSFKTETRTVPHSP